MEMEDRFQLVRAMYCPPNAYIAVPEGLAFPESRLDSDGNGSISGTWKNFQSFLFHGEYELCWDALFDIGLSQKLPSSFWDSLIEIAVIWKDVDRVRMAEKAKAS